MAITATLPLNRSYRYGFAMPERFVFAAPRGLNADVVRTISQHKNESEWMAQFRLNALKEFDQKPLPTWGPDLSAIDFQSFRYYLVPAEKQYDSWDEVPAEVKETYERLGIPEAERKFLAGVGGQYDSMAVYHRTRQELEQQGVVFLSMDEGLRQHPEIVRRYFGTIVPPNDNKFAALNSAVWSGGSFVYVPKGVRVEQPLQAYFRINAKSMGQFERTLIVVEEGAYVHYIEGCTASINSKDSLHAAVVEIIVKPGARARYTTLQNWSTNVYNLVTKRARVEQEGTMEWVDFNGGSKITMKFPSVYLVGRKARGDILSVAMAGAGQHQDTGGKVLCLAPETSGTITAKSVAFEGGRTSYRGLVKVAKNAKNAKVHVVCDALLLDQTARNDTYPTMKIDENSAQIGHEATVAKIGDDELFYLRSRGLSEPEARSMIVNGFFEPFTKQLPMEYAVEFNRLVELEMEGSVG